MVRTTKRVCPQCEGTGLILTRVSGYESEEESCERCKGNRIIVDVTFEVDIVEYEKRGRANKFKMVEL